MIELKEWTASEIEEYDDARLELAEDGKIDCTRVYIKADVDKVIADLEESHKMEVEQLLMEIVGLKEKHKKEVDRLMMKIAGLEKLVEIADKFVKQKGGFIVKDISFDGVKLEGMKND